MDANIPNGSHQGIEIAIDSFSVSAAEPSTIREKEEGRPMPDRILFVDDEARLLDALREFFIDFGYEVDCALSPELAKRMLSDNEYLAVVSDISFSGLDGREGLDLIDHIQQQSSSTPVIVLTAHVSGDLEREALRRGASGFLTKPTSLIEIEELVRGLKKDPGLT